MKRSLIENVRLIPYVSGGEIDRYNFITALLGINASIVNGTATEQKLSLAITECDTSGGEFTAVNDGAALINGQSVFKADVSAVNPSFNAQVLIDLVGLKRYIKITGTVSQTGNGNGSAAKVEIEFDSANFTTNLEAATTYYVKIGGVSIVSILTGETAPASDDELAALFNAKTFAIDGKTFTATVSGAKVTFSAGTVGETAAFDTTIEFYSDEACETALTINPDTYSVTNTAGVPKDEVTVLYALALGDSAEQPV